MPDTSGVEWGKTMDNFRKASIAFSGILAGPKRSDEAGLCVHTAHGRVVVSTTSEGGCFSCTQLSLIPTYVNSLIHISRTATATRRHLKTPVTMVFFSD